MHSPFLEYSLAAFDALSFNTCPLFLSASNFEGEFSELVLS